MGSLVAEIPDGIHVPMLYMYLDFSAVATWAALAKVYHMGTWTVRRNVLDFGVA